jgi:hypothetical protein
VRTARLASVSIAAHSARAQAISTVSAPSGRGALEALQQAQGIREVRAVIGGVLRAGRVAHVEHAVGDVALRDEVGLWADVDARELDAGLVEVVPRDEHAHQQHAR